MANNNTLLLDQTVWDLILDADGNITMAKKLYAMAQDVASACRLFEGEQWYNNLLGIPYLDTILGHNLPSSVINEYMKSQALTVDGVVNVISVSVLNKNRVLTGYITFNDIDGLTQTVNF